MAYQSEAALEQQFIEQLNKQEYTTVAIPDYDALVENFKVQFEAFMRQSWIRLSLIKSGSVSSTSCSESQFSRVQKS